MYHSTKLKNEYIIQVYSLCSLVSTPIFEKSEYPGNFGQLQRHFSKILEVWRYLHLRNLYYSLAVRCRAISCWKWNWLLCVFYVNLYIWIICNEYQRWPTTICDCSSNHHPLGKSCMFLNNYCESRRLFLFSWHIYHQTIQFNLIREFTLTLHCTMLIERYFVEVLVESIKMVNRNNVQKSIFFYILTV